MTQTEFHHAKPVYEYLDGWWEDISGCRAFDDLPKNAQAYVRALEEMSGAPDLGRRRRPGPRADRSSLRRRRPRRRRPVKVLVIGTGGREHALAPARSSRDPERHRGARRPGQPGHRRGRHAARRRPARRRGGRRPGRAARRRPGRGRPGGAAGRRRRRRRARARASPASGPSGEAARLEGSKAFAKEVMAAAGVPDRRRRASARPPSEAAAALDAFGPPYVVKDDGLAAGKGVVVTDDRDGGARARRGVRAGGRRGVPRRPRGLAVRDHRRHDGRTRCCRPRTSSGSSTATPGPNTGGMGAYTPLPWAPAGLVDEVHRDACCSRPSTRWPAAARRSPGCCTPASR